jgi:putative FmdB family regulatory protein
MPTYEYACSSCAHEWEFEQSIKEDPLKDCPKCNNPTAKRQISRGTGFILKGGGWYADLYASGSNKTPAKSDAGASSGEAAATKSDGGSTSPASSSDSSSGSASSGSTSASSASSSSTPATP